MSDNDPALRGMFSSPNGGFPQVLPDHWKSSDEAEDRTDLLELTDEELNVLGWKGPIQKPANTSNFTHDYQWNEETREYTSTVLSEFDRLDRVDYNLFWELLLDCPYYSRIKTSSGESLSVNTIATEFIVLISDAKMGNANVIKIQESLTSLLSSVVPTEGEGGKIKGIMTISGMIYSYSLTA
jgi:hypothetical protein